MTIHGFIGLALLATVYACHKDRALRQDVSRVTRVESKDAVLEKVPEPPEYDQPVDESVDVPAPITGAYLICAKISADSTGLQQKVGCRVDADGGMGTEVIKDRMDKISWTWQAQGSTVDLKMMDGEVPKGWLAIFQVQADAASIQSKLVFDLSFTLDGMPTKVRTDLVVVWNEDCALAPIQFESLGEKNGVGVAVSEQFRASHGVRFSTLSGTPVLLAQYNQPNANPVGYFGGPNNVGNFLASDQNGGKFFITDRHKQAELTDTLVIEYDRPVKEASMDLVDIDFSETYFIRAFNSQNQMISEVQIAAAVVGSRDGQLSHHVIRSPDGTASITKLQIHGSNPGATGIGFGLDNFAPRCSR